MRYAIVLALALSSAAVAQPYSDWAFIGNPSAGQPVALGSVDGGGNVTTILSGAQLANSFPSGACMDADNRHYLVGLGSSVNNASVIRVSPTGMIVQTITVSTLMTTAVDVAVDVNGDYLVLESNGTSAFQTRLYRVTPVVNTITTVWSIGGFYPAYALAIDGASGDALVVYQGFGTATVYRIAPSGTVVKSSATPVNLRGQLQYDWRTGDTIIGAWPNISPGAVLLKRDGAGNLSTLLAAGLNSGEGVYPDRASSANPRWIVASDPGTSGLFAVDATTNAITTLHATTSYVYSHVFPDRGRNLTVIRQGATLRDFAISIPADAGRNYVLGLSVTGTTAGVPLADGRRIPLTIDPVTAASVNGVLGPILTGHVGTLDASGRGVANLNVSGLGLPPMPIWAIVLTLDPSAPLGIRTITDPALAVL